VKTYSKNPDRFWSKVDKGKAKECWLWTASCSHKGYGKLWWGTKLEGAHRISYMLEHDVNELPKKIDGSRVEVMHSCDNPSCVNPGHLILGTTLLNQRDKTAKGRHHLLKRKTCNYGHEWTPENTGYLKPPSHHAKDGAQWVSRYCKTCHSKRGKSYYRTVDKERRQSDDYRDRKNARRRELYAQRNPNAKLRGPYEPRKKSE